MSEVAQYLPPLLLFYAALIIWINKSIIDMLKTGIIPPLEKVEELRSFLLVWFFINAVVIGVAFYNIYHKFN